MVRKLNKVKNGWVEEGNKREGNELILWRYLKAYCSIALPLLVVVLCISVALLLCRSAVTDGRGLQQLWLRVLEWREWCQFFLFQNSKVWLRTRSGICSGWRSSHHRDSTTGFVERTEKQCPSDCTGMASQTPDGWDQGPASTCVEADGSSEVQLWGNQTWKQSVIWCNLQQFFI